MKGQKEALVEYVKAFGYTVPSKVNLTNAHFESIVDRLVDDIQNDLVSYGKDKTIGHEVRKYVRSMIKNHLNKAKELNGGQYSPKTGKQKIVEKISHPLDKTQLTPGLSNAFDKYMGEGSGTEE
jgi:hypothetical protein